MKRNLLLVSILLSTFALVACGGEKPAEQPTQPAPTEQAPTNENVKEPEPIPSDTNTTSDTNTPLAEAQAQDPNSAEVKAGEDQQY